MNTPNTEETIRTAVRKNYGAIANRGTSDCGCSPPSTSVEANTAASNSCCGTTTAEPPASPSARMGYSETELRDVPEGADLGLGCGNPQAIAAIKPGENVLDLGSGAGFDAFLAARQVGDKGHVIGVDMTPEMISRAQENARTGGYSNVEFKLAEIETLPVAGDTIDVIISNCVINLSPDKPAVFREAFRVLKPGGRLAISDIVATAKLPGSVRQDLELYTGCVAGAEQIDELESILEKTGFVDVRIKPKDASRKMIREWAPDGNVADYIVSASIEATKP